MTLWLTANPERSLDIGDEFTWSLSAHWRIDVAVRGFNGVGGYWIDETWRWACDGRVHHTQHRTLSLAASRQLDEAFREHQRGMPAPDRPVLS